MFKNALLLTGSNLFLRAVGMAFQVYTANIMGAAGVGLLQLVMSVGMLAMTVGSSGVRVAAMYLSAQEFGKRRLGGVRQAVTCCLQYGLAVSALTGLALFFLSDTVSAYWIQDMEAALSLRVMAAFLPATCLCSIMSGYFTACGKIRTLVFTEVTERFVAIGITLLLILWARGSTERLCCAIVAGSSGSSLFSFLVLYGVYRKDRRGYGKAPKGLHMGKRLFRLCIPLALNDYLRSGLSSLEQFLIPYGLAKAASRQAGLAGYGIVVGMVFPVIMFPAAILFSISDLLVPELSRCTASGDNRRIRSLTGRCFRLGAVFAAMTAGTLYCTGDALGELLYHNQAAGYYIRVFSPMILFLYLDAIVDGMHKGLGQQVHCVRYNTFTNLLDVVFLFLLLPKFGIAGYVFTFACTHLINFFLSINRLLKVTDYAPPLGAFVRLLLALLICGMAATGLPGTNLWLSLALQGGCFLVLLLVSCRVLHILEPQDIRWLRATLSFHRS